jgi:hypothetical protein
MIITEKEFYNEFYNLLLFIFVICESITIIIFIGIVLNEYLTKNWEKEIKFKFFKNED